MSEQIFRIHNKQWSLRDLNMIGANPGLKFGLSEEALSAVRTCREFLDNKLANDDSAIYGINTGFGYLRDKKIEKEDLEQLQYNLIRSHACGMGDEVPESIVRWMLLLKARSLAFGHSGVAEGTINRLLDFYNAGISPVIYNQGSLGASGDLAPLAHLSLPLIGEGEVNFEGKRMGGGEALAAMDWDPIRLQSKEGLALLNGTQFMLAFGVHILLRAYKYLEWANVISAMSLEGFDGRIEPFDPDLHKIRPHSGQKAVAAEMRKLLKGSAIVKGVKTDVQDPYAFRCVPQVHGASMDALGYCEKVFITEVNSTTDNPNIFAEEEKVISGGNFHGQPLALALDFMSIALAELGSISERRVFQLLSGQRGLPPFLVAKPGLNSGLMIAQYLSAGVVSMNKQLCTPSSVDTIPSSNGQEDHVSMGANAAVKCLKITDNLRTILSVELLTAAQAVGFRAPKKSSNKIMDILKSYFNVVPPIIEDRTLYPEIQKTANFIDSFILE